MNTFNEFEHCYSGLIAGCLPTHSGNVEQSLLYILQDHFQTKQFQYVTSQHADHIFYIAQRSDALTNLAEFATPLAAAFPDHPDHRGDGIYQLTNELLSAVIIKKGNSLQAMTHSKALIDAELSVIELPTFDATEASPSVLRSMTSRDRLIADRLSAITTKFSFYAATLFVCIGLASHATSVYFDTKVENSKLKTSEEITDVLTKIEHASPLSEQVARYQQVAATVIRAGGWIDEYQFKDGKESFSVSLPEWVTQDYIKALGTGAVAEKDPVNNVIRVKK